MMAASDDLKCVVGVFHLFIYSSATTWMVLEENKLYGIYNQSVRETYQSDKIK